MESTSLAGAAEVTSEARDYSEYVEGEVQAGRNGAKATPVKTRDLENLIESQGWRCALSGVELNTSNAALDHKLPVERGGAHELGNLQWVSQQVNKAKNTMTNEEFISLCKVVAERHG